MGFPDDLGVGGDLFLEGDVGRNPGDSGVLSLLLPLVMVLLLPPVFVVGVDGVTAVHVTAAALGVLELLLLSVVLGDLEDDPLGVPGLFVEPLVLLGVLLVLELEEVLVLADEEEASHLQLTPGESPALPPPIIPPEGPALLVLVLGVLLDFGDFEPGILLLTFLGLLDFFILDGLFDCFVFVDGLLPPLDNDPASASTNDSRSSESPRAEHCAVARAAAIRALRVVTPTPRPMPRMITRREVPIMARRVSFRLLVDIFYV